MRTFMCAGHSRFLRQYGLFRLCKSAEQPGTCGTRSSRIIGTFANAYVTMKNDKINKPVHLFSQIKLSLNDLKLFYFVEYELLVDFVMKTKRPYNFTMTEFAIVLAEDGFRL